ncbi:MAG: phosphopantothenoylcysteine decarboxylase, partial [Fervidobacterium sp.]
IMCAAVADYRPKNISQQKIKKTLDTLNIELEKTPDILDVVGHTKKENQIVVGFAAETENIVENAYEKLVKKNANVIVANDARVAMESDRNHVYIIFKDKAVVELEGTKEEIAKELLIRICKNI